MSRLHSVLTAAALPVILSFVLVGLLMACALVAAGERPAPSAGAQARCRLQLDAIQDGEPALARLEAICRRHLRFGAAGHNPIPSSARALTPAALTRAR